MAGARSVNAIAFAFANHWQAIQRTEKFAQIRWEQGTTPLRA